jgi:hypothetical protein
VSWRDRLTDWWRRRRWTQPRVKHVAYYEGRSDVPESLARDTLAVVGTRERPKWAVLECPCGRGHQLVVSLSPQHPPHWRLGEGQRGPSLKPSIDSRRAYRCHFWLRDGQVQWCRD